MGKTNADNIRSIWFCNVQTANGVNVYTTLLEKPSEEIPVEPVEPTEPSDEVTTPDNTIEEQKQDKIIQGLSKNKIKAASFTEHDWLKTTPTNNTPDTI